MQNGDYQALNKDYSVRENIQGGTAASPFFCDFFEFSFSYLAGIDYHIEAGGNDRR